MYFLSPGATKAANGDSEQLDKRKAKALSTCPGLLACDWLISLHIVCVVQECLMALCNELSVMSICVHGTYSIALCVFTMAEVNALYLTKFET